MDPPLFTGVESFSVIHIRESVASSTSESRPLRESSPEALRPRRAPPRHSHSMSVRSSRKSDYRMSQLRDRVQPLTLVFKDLTFTITKRIKNKRETKVILDHLDGMFRPGRLTAIMGPSGAGKTSLLDCLAGNLLGGQISGKVLVNGDDYTGKKIKDVSGFVFQDDVILPTMTVREAIEQSALLRIPKSVTREERKRRIEDIIEIFHLQGCENTRIGTPDQKGISGGERKRTATAMEMIANPPMLFLDEPTSGLDTFTAYTVVLSLHRLARQGRTVIATIHQPSSKLFHLFDDLILLSEGRIVYQGDAQHSIEYFAKLGFRCPRYSNPADYYFMKVLRQFNVRDRRTQRVLHYDPVEDIGRMEESAGAEGENIAMATSTAGSAAAGVGAATVIGEDEGLETGTVSTDGASRTAPMRESELGDSTWMGSRPSTVSSLRLSTLASSQGDSTKDRIAALQQSWLESKEHQQLLQDINDSPQEGVFVETLRKRAPFPTQFKYLFMRASKNAIRNPMIVLLSAIKCIFLGLLVGLIYLDSNRYSVTVQIRNKSGAIFFLVLNTFFNSVYGVLGIFAMEKQVFFREYKGGYYGTTAYFFTKFLVELPYAFIFPYLMVIIAYYMVGLNPPFSDYLMSATFAAVTSICGVATGVLLASIFSDLQVLLAITPAILLPLLLLSGIFVAAASIPGFLIWIRYISPIYYGSTGMMQVEFKRPFPNCNQNICDGSLAYKALGITSMLPMGVNLALELTIWGVLVIAGYIALALVTRIKFSSS